MQNNPDEIKPSDKAEPNKTEGKHATIFSQEEIRDILKEFSKAYIGGN
jgi:hypothetical protein